MRFPLLAFLLLVVSCGSTDPLAGVRVVTTLDRLSVSVSDTVRITLSVTNGSRRSVRAISPASYGICLHAFRVFNGAEREVEVPTGFCVAAVPHNLVAPAPIDLAPGASVTVVDFWNPAGSTFNGAAIPPGVYRVQGLYHVEGKAIFSPATNVTVVP